MHRFYYSLLIYLARHKNIPDIAQHDKSQATGFLFLVAGHDFKQVLRIHICRNADGKCRRLKRIFNPVLQGLKFDPNGDYIRRWVPELAKLPTEHLHSLGAIEIDRDEFESALNRWI